MRRQRWMAGLAACVAVGSLAVGAAPAEAQKKSRDVITREEILQSSLASKDVYQVIRSLRPHFLTPKRGMRSLGGAEQNPLMVYVDGNRQGEITTLGMIIATDVFDVTYLDPARAENQYGITHNGGAVLVRLMKSMAKPDSGDRPLR